jgi:NADH-quinone oxidoreductase subunit J
VTAGTLVFWGLAVVALVGAIAVVFSRDAIRMVAGLGAFLVAVAGYFLLYRMPFLAVAQVFVYVGGVLVMMIFALMAIRRDEAGRPRLDGRYDLSALVVSGGLFFLLNWSLSPTAPTDLPEAAADPVGELGSELLGRMLPHFELAGLLLLAALVAVIVVMGGSRER